MYAIYQRALPNDIEYTVSCGLSSAYAILGQSYCGLYSLIDLVLLPWLVITLCIQYIVT